MSMRLLGKRLGPSPPRRSDPSVDSGHFSEDFSFLIHKITQSSGTNRANDKENDKSRGNLGFGGFPRCIRLASRVKFGMRDGGPSLSPTFLANCEQRRLDFLGSVGPKGVGTQLEDRLWRPKNGKKLDSRQNPELP